MLINIIIGKSSFVTTQNIWKSQYLHPMCPQSMLCAPGAQHPPPHQGSYFMHGSYRPSQALSLFLLLYWHDVITVIMCIDLQ